MKSKFLFAAEMLVVLLTGCAGNLASSAYSRGQNAE